MNLIYVMVIFPEKTIWIVGFIAACFIYFYETFYSQPAALKFFNLKNSSLIESVSLSA